MKLKTVRKNKVVFNMRSVYRGTLTRQASNADTFYHVPLESSDDGHKCVAVVDPIYMLFNQERLDKMGDEAVKKWLKSMEDVSNNPLTKLRQTCCDDDLISMVKSRHLQAPCELSAWADYMAENLDKFKELYAQEVANQRVKDSAQLNPEVQPQSSER